MKPWIFGIVGAALTYAVMWSGGLDFYRSVEMAWTNIMAIIVFFMAFFYAKIDQ